MAQPSWRSSLGQCLLLFACSCELVAPLRDVEKPEASVDLGCGELPRAKVESTTTGSGPDWGVVLVRLAASPEAIYMDKTEVTVAEYQPWVDGSGGSFTDWHAWCSNKTPGASNPAKAAMDACTATIPARQTDPFALEKPIRCVDWCDAEAFCRTARNGHLCYKSVGGGTALPENKADEWSSACNNAATTVWPWGDAHDLSACNLGQSHACGSFGFSCGPVPVQTFPRCRNVNGNFDLIGNVAEWLGTCAANMTSPESGCQIAGGSYDDELDSLNCSDLKAQPKYGRSPAIGFRCCYDLTLAERQKCGLP